MFVSTTSARASQPEERGDQEAGQVQLDRDDWAGLDLPHRGRGCGGM